MSCGVDLNSSRSAGVTFIFTNVAHIGYIRNMQDTVVRARVSADLKLETEKIFEQLGITTTDAIRMFLAQVKIHGGLPFAVQVRAEAGELLRSSEHRQSTLDSFYND